MAMSGLARWRGARPSRRNDIAGTDLDPLLVMIVVAPIIWTLGVVVRTPPSTEMLTERYQPTWLRTTRAGATVFLLRPASSSPVGWALFSSG